MDQSPSANPCYDPRGSKGFFDVWGDDEAMLHPLGDAFDEDEGAQQPNNTNSSNFSTNPQHRTDPGLKSSGNQISNQLHNGPESPRRDESRGRERRQGVTGPNQSVQIANQLSLSGTSCSCPPPFPTLSN